MSEAEPEMPAVFKSRWRSVLSSITIQGLFLPIARWIVAQNWNTVDQLDENLTQARMSTDIESYLSRLMGWGALVTGLISSLVLLGMVGLYQLGILTNSPIIGFRISNDTVVEVINILRVPFIIGTVVSIVGVLVAGVIAGLAYALPASRKTTRKREIDALFPDAVSFMYALSLGGLNQIEIIRAVANAEETYGEVSREFQSVVKESEYAGQDYRTALREAAIRTPSNNLAQFITDLLSIISSGGSIDEFLEQRTESVLDEQQKQEEGNIEQIQLAGEIFITLAVAPVMLMTILLVSSLLGNNTTLIMYIITYIVTPVLSMAFVVLVSTVQPDELGSGELTYNGEDVAPVGDQYNMEVGTIESYEQDTEMFSSLYRQRLMAMIGNLIRHPHYLFRDNPLYTLMVTVPLALGWYTIAILSGIAPLSWDAFTANPIGGTVIFLYAPMYLVGIPLSIAEVWNQRHYGGIDNDISEHLRKIASANDTGMTLQEALETTARDSNDLFASELMEVVERVKYGINLNRALISFNNKYKTPSLARIMRVITEAHKTSGHISDVLSTTAQITENERELVSKRKRETNSQVMIIVGVFVVMVGVMAAIQYNFVGLIADVIADAPAEGVSGSGGDSAGLNFESVASPAVLTTLYLHTVVLQGLFNGIGAGYMRTGDLLPGIKYSIVLSTLPLVVWIIITNI